MRSSQSFFLALSPLLSLVSANFYAPLETYQGDNFFDKFDFMTFDDPTGGYVDYKSRADAEALNLISSTGTTAKWGVGGGVLDPNDNTIRGRPSVRLEGKVSYTKGLFIADIAHMPGNACGIWPAFWTLGSGNWPMNGEIDIIEGVNQLTRNKASLHSGDTTCAIQSAPQFGTIATTDCQTIHNGNMDNFAGCGIDSGSNSNFGSPFNAQGGGTYAMQWTDTFIKTWFFPRGREPPSLLCAAPDVTEFGIPDTFFSGCDIASNFREHRMVFTTTFCGSWAGADGIYSQSGCPLTFPSSEPQWKSCKAQVAGHPETFNEGFWEINSIKVFSETQNPIPAGCPASSSSSSIASSTSSVASSSSSTASSSTWSSVSSSVSSSATYSASSDSSSSSYSATSSAASDSYSSSATSSAASDSYSSSATSSAVSDSYSSSATSSAASDSYSSSATSSAASDSYSSSATSSAASDSYSSSATSSASSESYSDSSSVYSSTNSYSYSSGQYTNSSAIVSSTTYSSDYYPPSTTASTTSSVYYYDPYYSSSSSSASSSSVNYYDPYGPSSSASSSSVNYYDPYGPSSTPKSTTKSSVYGYDWSPSTTSGSKYTTSSKPFVSYPPITTCTYPAGFRPIKAVIKSVIVTEKVYGTITSKVSLTSSYCAMCHYTETAKVPVKVGTMSKAKYVSGSKSKTKVQTVTVKKPSSTPAAPVYPGSSDCGTVTSTVTVKGTRSASGYPVNPAKSSVPSSYLVKPVPVVTPPAAYNGNGTTTPYKPLQVTQNAAGKNFAGGLALIGAAVAAVMML